MSRKNIEANVDPGGADTTQFRAAFYGSQGRPLEELDVILRRSLVLLHNVRSEMNVEQTDHDELPHLGGLAKMQSLDQFAFLKPIPPPIPLEPDVFRPPEAAEDMIPMSKPDDPVSVLHESESDDHALARGNDDATNRDLVSDDEGADLSKRSKDGLSNDSEDYTKDMRFCKFKTVLESQNSMESQKSMVAGHSLNLRRQNASTFSAEEQHVMKPVSKRSKRARAIEALLDDPDSSRLACYFNVIVSIIIQLSVIFSLSQTVESPPLDMGTFFLIQITLDVFFLAELGLRLCVCSNVKMFAKNVHNVIDFIAAVLPLSLRAAQSLELVDVKDDGVARYIVFCVAPFLREMKVLRRVQQFHLFGFVLRDIREAVQTLLMLLMMMILVFSSLLYIFEPRDNISSMPQAVWLTIVTMTTVGYGDITPESTPGHIIASTLALCSVLYMAMPIGIIGNAFTQTWQDRDFILLMTKTRGAMLKLGYVATDLPAVLQYYSEGTGELLLDNFLNMVTDMNLGLSPDRALKVFEFIDRNGSGSIDEQELVRSVFPSAYHDLYQNKKDSVDRSQEDDESIVGRESIASRAVESLRNISRRFSYGVRVSPSNS